MQIIFITILFARELPILNEILGVQIDKVNEDKVLQLEYEDILAEINKQKYGSIKNGFIIVNVNPKFSQKAFEN